MLALFPESVCGHEILGRSTVLLHSVRWRRQGPIEKIRVPHLRPEDRTFPRGPYLSQRPVFNLGALIHFFQSLVQVWALKFFLIQLSKGTLQEQKNLSNIKS